MKINDLTAHQIAELRLKCVKHFIKTSSKHDLQKGEIFIFAESAFSFIVRGLENIQEKNSEKTFSDKKSQSVR